MIGGKIPKRCHTRGLWPKSPRVKDTVDRVAPALMCWNVLGDIMMIKYSILKSHLMESSADKFVSEIFIAIEHKYYLFAVVKALLKERVDIV